MYRMVLDKGVMAPVLFNLYFAVVLEQWRIRLAAQSPEYGVKICCNEKSLFPRNTRLVRTPTHTISDLEYADDGLFFASTPDSMAVALQVFHSVTTDFGLSINFTKTKFMGAGYGLPPEDCLDLPIGDAVAQHDPPLYILGQL